MFFDFTQVFLMFWIIAFWAYYLLTYGRVEGKHEQSTRGKYGTPARWAPFFGMAFLGWTVVIVIFFFHYDSIEWGWRFDLLDHAAIKILGIAILCVAFLLNVLFTASVGQSVQASIENGTPATLVTTGVYGWIRHPGYLAFFAVAIGGFLLIPNFITLALAVYTFVVVYGHTLEEEKKLEKMYGSDYERYQRTTGRFFPKIRRTDS